MIYSCCDVCQHDAVGALPQLFLLGDVMCEVWVVLLQVTTHVSLAVCAALQLPNMTLCVTSTPNVYIHGPLSLLLMDCFYDER